MANPSVTEMLTDIFTPPMTVEFLDPWFVKAYGEVFIGATPEEAMEAADAFGEEHQLRAVSLIARKYQEIV